MPKCRFKPIKEGVLMKIEFFHDTVCSFCFPMSYKMREVVKRMPDINIVHRSFALVWEKEDLVRMFGRLDVAKREILTHWEHANLTDPLKRFNPEGMRQQTFDFPHSKPALLACKAAFMVGGDKAYWDVFDALQRLLFMKSQDISSQNVIEKAVASTGIDMKTWTEYLMHPDVLMAVKEDLQLAKKYAITSVPTLIINETYRINGALPLETILTQLEKIAKEETQQLNDKHLGAACHLTDDEWICD